MPDSRLILEKNEQWYRWMRKKSYHSAFITFCKILLIAGSTLLFVLSWLIKQQSYKLHATNTLILAALFAVAYFMYTKTYGGFRVDQNKTELIFSQLLAIALTDALIFIAQALVLSRVPPIGMTLLGIMVHIAYAMAWTFIVTRIHARLNIPPRTAVIYHDAEAVSFARTVREDSGHFEVVKELQLTECCDNLSQELDGIEAVFLCGVPSTMRNDVIKFCISRGIAAYVRPRTGDILMAGAQNVQLFNVPVLLCRRKSPTMYYSVLKRTMDILISVLMLIIFSPTMVWAAIAIKRQDGGPVFYRQKRFTRNGKVFEIIKFRSMVPDAEGDGVARLASEGDSRITPIGAFIRKTRIDELPQLFNILLGEMSIVGPRPERPEIAAQYRQTLPEFHLRLQVKAGLTGYAQVHGKYNTDPYDKLQMDLLYIASQSIVEDLKLIFATIKILPMKESTQGIGNGQITAEKTEKAVEKSA